MNSAEKGFLTLIKSAVVQQAFPLPEDFSLEEAYCLISSHHIWTLAFEGAMLCGISRKDPVMEKLFMRYCKSLQISEGQMYEVGRLFAAFEENAIDYLPFKGCVLKSCYPRPELRAMGDADILIRREQYPRVKELLTEHGFRWESDKPCNATWNTDMLSAEIHWRLFNDDHEKYRLITGHFGNGWKNAVRQEGHRYAMTPEDTYLYLFVHFTKHYRHSGIGCRQAADLWLYKRLHPELDEMLLRKNLEKIKLLSFYENIQALLAYWFEEGTADERVEYISRYILSNGSWGSMKNVVLTGAAQHMHPGEGGKKAKLRFYFRHLFPGCKDLEKKYPILRRFPWLLPAVWIVRMFDKLFVTKDAREKLEHFQSVLQDDQIEQRYRELQYVGLSKEWEQ